MNWKKFNRKTHYWGSIIIALPILVVIGSGLLLQVKKQLEWVQPATQRGAGDTPTLSFEEILMAAQQVPEAEITSWRDVDRLDVRPGKGVIKIRSENGWEIQIDGSSASILQVAYRRSDLIESLHDGSFFHEHAKLWVFLPAAIVLLILWITGLYLFLTTHFAKRRNRLRRESLES